MTELRDIMTTNVSSCKSVDNVFEAAVKMKEGKVGLIPVLEGNQLIGVVTDRDIVLRCIAEKRPGSTKITDVISTDLVTGTPDMSAEDAEKLMSVHQVRRIPVVDNGNLVGIVALADLANHRQTKEEAGSALGSISEDRGQIQH